MTQNQEILRHLKNGLTLTPKQALRQYGTMRLAARVFDLKQQGHDIRADIIKVNGARVARYSLVRS